MELRVLTWNLFHGRAQPPAGRSLEREFATAIANWRWDLALLQEVPPWWEEPLARAAGAASFRALTSRNALLPLRRALAERRPDLIKSNGGGANVILARGALERREALLLRRWPERRVAQVARMGAGVWVANLHATVHSERRARADTTRALRFARERAREQPLVFGGDLNVRGVELDGLVTAGEHDVDYVFAAGLGVAAPPEVLERGALSDHAPLLVTLAR